MATNKEDRSFKTLINKRTTDENKAFYEEVGDLTINVHNVEIWSQDIDPSPAQAIVDGVAEARTLFSLTEDISVPNKQAWFAEEFSSRLKDWISDKFGSSYGVRLFDGNDAEIFITDAVGWFFDHQTGILTFTGNAASFTTPFKVTGHRYIGSKGIGSGGVHATDHILGGSDVIDADQLKVDFTPTNYTPDVTPPEVTDVDHLSSHLAGIDNALAGSSFVTFSSTVSSSSTVAVDSISTVSKRSVSWIISVSDNTALAFNTRKIQAISQNGSTATHNEFAVVGDSVNYDINVVINSGNMELRITNNESNDISIEGIRSAIDV